MKSTHHIALTALALAAVVGFASPASAIDFTVVEAESYLKIEIGVGIPPDVTVVTSPQVGTSDTTSMSGTILGNLVGDDLTLTGGLLNFALQPEWMQPDIDGVAGSAPAQYGLFLTLPPFANGPAAIRELTGNITTSAPASIAGGIVDSTLFDLGIVTGQADINLSGVFAVETRADLGDNAATNEGANGTVVWNGDEVTLILPLLVNVIIPAGDDVPLDLTATLTGQIVLVGVIPEPGTIAMLGMGLIGLVAVGRRRFRKA